MLLPKRVSKIQESGKVKLYDMMFFFFQIVSSFIWYTCRSVEEQFYSTPRVAAAVFDNSSVSLISPPLCSTLKAAVSPNNNRCQNRVLLKLYNCCVLIALFLVESQLCLIDCDCDWQTLGSTVWPLMLSHLRSPACLRQKKQEGYWLLSSWHWASFRQAIPGEQLSGLIAPKKKDGEAVKLTSCLQNR